MLVTASDSTYRIASYSPWTPLGGFLSSEEENVKKPPTWIRRASAGFVASALTAGALTLASAGTPALAGSSPDIPKAGWSPTDQDRLAQAEAEGQQTVDVLVGAQDGQASAVADRLAALGASVDYRDDSLGYLRASVATDRADRIAELSGVETVEIDAALAVPDPRPDASESPAPQPAPGAATPAANPYMPIQDMNAAQFVAEHPTLDGRGVTIGIIDTGVDLAHPALRTTTTGERKIVDWVTATSPTDDGDPTWISMATKVSGATFTVDSRTWTAPRSGSYRFGVFNERAASLGGEVGNDVNRDGNRAGSSGLFGVLWDGDKTVWVDTNQNGSFADETPMTDYKVRYDVGTFGTDNPATRWSRRCRSSCRSTARTSSSTSASSPASTARTSPASPPATGCSAAR